MSYPQFPQKCRSLLSKFLTLDVYEKLKKKQTSNGFSFKQSIQSGIDNLDSGIGFYAGDEESYQLFSPLLDKIINDYHDFSVTNNHQSCFETQTINDLNPDPQGRYVLSTRIRVGRNIKGMPLGAAISQQQRDEVETLVIKALSQLTGELKGNYYSLDNMEKAIQLRLIEDHFLFKEGDRFLASAGLNRDWPKGRGIYHNDQKTFLVWVNEEDQLRIISMQQGSNIKQVFSRLVKSLKLIEKELIFSFNNHLGYISSCPTNLGTAMRASVHIKLPKLASNMELFKELTNKYDLQIRGVHGEHSESQGGVFDISNRRRLGVTEVQIIQSLYNGVAALIKAEESL